MIGKSALLCYQGMEQTFDVVHADDYYAHFRSHIGVKYTIKNGYYAISTNKNIKFALINWKVWSTIQKYVILDVVLMIIIFIMHQL